MSQTFADIQGTDTLSASRTTINNNFDAIRSRFVGATAPSNPKAYDTWLDTTTGYRKQRNAANDAWIVMGLVASEYEGLLPIAGGTMAGILNMGGYTLTNLGLGSGTAAARQQELDTKAAIAAPVFTGDAKVSQDPAGNDSIPRRSWTEGRYLKLAGGTMTGFLVLSGDATAVLHPVSLQQLKAFVLFNTSTGHRHDGSDARKVKGSSIDSESAGSKAVLLASGTGTSSWSAVPANYCLLRDNQEIIINRTSGIAWTTLDISAFVPVETTAAILKVELVSASASPIILYLRPTGTTPAVPQEWSRENSSSEQAVTMVTVSGRQFDYMCTFTGSGSIKVYLLGYIRNT